jgi:photosystem II stability/assembly factor-like uncharacterized protein
MKKFKKSASKLFLMAIVLMFTLNTKAQKSPDIDISPTEFNYGNVLVGNQVQHFFTFSNTGDETITVTNITFSDPAFSIEYTQFTIDPNTQGQLPVKFKPTEIKYYEATMKVYSNDPDENPFEVVLAGTGINSTIDGWEWINTGYDYILTDMEFPLGQNKIGYAVGQLNTYNGEGIVIKTTDGGDTWERMTPEGTLWLDAISFIDLDTGYVGGWSNYILKTTDGGETWTQVNFPFANEVYKIRDINFRDANHGIVSVAVIYGVEPKIYVTDDGGQTWTNGTGFTLPDASKVEYVQDSIVVAVGLQDAICRSTDGGLTWQQVFATGDPENILLSATIDETGFGFATGDYGHIYRTRDYGLNWEGTFLTTDDLLHTSYIWDHDTIWIVGTPELVYKSTDGGNNWDPAYNGNFQRAFYRILFTDNYTGFICASHGTILRKEGYPEVPEINVNPQDLDFGTVGTGQDKTLTFEIKNTGFGPLEVTSIESTNDVFSVDSPDGFVLNPSDSKTISVTFNPTGIQTYDGQIIVSSNDPNNPVITVTVTGEGSLFKPIINVDPQSLDFGDVVLNNAETLQIIVSNNGNTTLQVTNITSNIDDFSVDITSFDIEANESKTVNVTFTPQTEQLYNAELTIASNDPDNPTVIVTLTGNGVFYSPVIVVNPTEIIFDTTLVNQSSAMALNIINEGDAVLVVSDIVSSEAVFTVDISSFSVDPNDSKYVTVYFTPNMQGEFVGTLTVENNDPVNGSLEIPVSGYGVVETAIEDIDESNVNIYPNPVRNILYVENVRNSIIKLYDLSGRLVFETTASSDNEKVDVSNLKQGIYLLHVKTENATITKKINVLN